MKSGFVMLAGRSNVGKSTLLNALIGQKVAIMSEKPQTTRHPVRGVLNDKRGQIVFVDTPGVFLGKKDPVSKRLNELVKESLEGIDAIVYVVDPTRPSGDEEKLIQELLMKANAPIILVVNKTDLHARERQYMDDVKRIAIGEKQRFEISAMTHKNLNKLVDALYDLMPIGEAYYPELQVTDLTHKQWIQELIREKAFEYLGQELPYSIHVEVEDMEEREGGSLYIQSTIYTSEERHKGMIIGKAGQKLKAIGSAARKELESTSGRRVYLELNVKVDPKWRERFK